ncbi:MAG: hypothetical protein Q7S44_03200 [bacterium]|nr:hypothetical protein [bacterium]
MEEQVSLENVSGNKRGSQLFKWMIATSIPTVLIVGGVTIASWGLAEEFSERIRLGIIIAVMGAVIALIEAVLALKYIKTEGLTKDEVDVWRKPIF